MSKKCIEEFNPWPPFVDIFSSTILVLLLFMLILIVNLGYYAQFKFKVSYTGTITTDELILNDNPSKNKIEKKPENTLDDTTVQEKIDPTPIVVPEEQIQASSVKPKDEDPDTVFDLERAGRDLTQMDDQETTQQKTQEEDDHMIINFAGKEIILDDVIIKKVKSFIKKVKEKYPKHKIIISSMDPSNQISSTIARQISLARTLNTRNLIRKLDYKKSDVRVRLLDDNLKSKLPQTETGLIYIAVKVSR